MTEDESIIHARAIVRDARPGFELELAQAYLAIVTAHVDRKQKRDQAASDAPSGGAK